ncbi:MAG: trimethylamine methyltransferase family protein [Bacteroidetes bacterium]|nr:trimethylamine methyltransferase family protein [Bacteroidota bacterium]
MRPTVKFLSKSLIEQIISEAKDILCKLGVKIENPELVSKLADYGARIENDASKVFFTNEIIERALKSVPKSFQLFDSSGNETNNFSGNNIHYTPGSSAINFLDYESQDIKQPLTKDYIRYVKIVDQLKYIASQSTAFIPTDVQDKFADSYRLFLSLLYSGKPVVTGTFTAESFEVMKNFLVTVRGSKEALKEKPLSVFTACPTSPLKWGDVSSQNLTDCARYSIPVEIVCMPMAGFISPVTLTGTLIQHTAETLSGIVISQMTNPGTPILYGGSPAIFDIRYETTPMGAVETMMIDCAYNEIGKYLGIPTQAYIALSDSKFLDAQAGLEDGMGATLAALSGINNISGPGMMDFENCFSLEKLVFDNEVCGKTLRMIKGIEPKDDFPAISLFTELLEEEHLLISKHTRKHLRTEHHFPGSIINRASRSRWIEEGSTTLLQRAHSEVERLVSEYSSSHLTDEVRKELINLMEQEAKTHGQGSLPEREV